jgi:hypothetical protein
MQRFVAFAASAGIVLATETATASALRQAPVAPHVVAGVQRAPGGRSGPTATTRRRAAQVRKVSVVQERLQRDVVLADAVRQRLPIGTSVIDVSAGFSDVGQFVAAVNASHSLGIPMAELRRRMAGDGMPLLLALQDIRPGSHYRGDATRAEKEAASMLGPAESSKLALAGPR